MSELHGYKRNHIFRDLYSSLVRSLCKVKFIYIYKDSRGFKLYIYPADLTVIGNN